MVEFARVAMEHRMTDRNRGFTILLGIVDACV
jgi:hypothetical protein